MKELVTRSIAAMVAIICIWGEANGQDASFKGKAVQIIVGYSTGGGVDVEGRWLAKYLERYLPGNPALTVRNMPGAAGKDLTRRIGE